MEREGLEPILRNLKIHSTTCSCINELNNKKRSFTALSWGIFYIRVEQRRIGEAAMRGGGEGGGGGGAQHSVLSLKIRVHAVHGRAREAKAY